MKNKYKLVIWSEVDDRGTAIDLWQGGKILKGIWLIIFKYRSKIKPDNRITLQKIIDPELEANGILPKVILNLGNSKIQRFKCVHRITI